MQSTKHIYISKAWIILYAVLVVVLIPWVFNIAENLPSHHVAQHWDAVWAGFDAMMVLMLLMTVYFAVKRQVWVVITTTALATMFLVDAWFDILTSKPGREQRIAIFFGVVEFALAILTFKLVHHVVRHTSSQHNNIKLVPKAKPSDQIGV